MSAGAAGSAPPLSRRQRWLLRLVPVLAVPLLRVLMGCVRVRFDQGDQMRAARALGKPVIFCIWHESLLIFVHTHRHRGIRVLISRHFDGALIARTVERLGFRTARGSSTRGGAAGLKELIQAGKSEASDLALTPDGPRGPRREVKPGIVHLAAATGFTVVPGTVIFRRCWRAKSWDRFMVPLPGSRGVVRVGEPLQVPAGVEQDASGVDELRRKIQDEMATCEAAILADFDAAYRRGESLARFDPR